MKYPVLKMLRLSLIIGLLSAFISCEKEAGTGQVPGNDPANSAEALSTLAQIPLQFVAVLSENANGIVRPGAGCYKVTPHRTNGRLSALSIDFGAGCELYGFTHKGKVDLEISRNEYNTFISTFTFTGYAIDDLIIDGDFQTTDLTFISVEFGDGYDSFQILPGDLNTTYKGQKFRYTGSIELYREKGKETPQLADDVFRVFLAGDPYVQFENGYSFKLDGSFYVLPSCRWPTSGTVKYLSGTMGEVNFGDGECDNEITYTSEGKSKKILL
ncbi:MAG: hypothetical protein INR69_08010 [Mucilaginibacter polytrichastri]|nr:hypothetical protein [Mucilaginibacter polytrichastri]